MQRKALHLSPMERAQAQHQLQGSNFQQLELRRESSSHISSASELSEESILNLFLMEHPSPALMHKADCKCHPQPCLPPQNSTVQAMSTGTEGDRACCLQGLCESSILPCRDFALIAEETVDLALGLNVVTGESGAGKSVLVTCLGQMLGAPATENCIRPPASSAVIEGTVHLPASAVVFYPPSAPYVWAAAHTSLIAMTRFAVTRQ